MLHLLLRRLYACARLLELPNCPCAGRPSQLILGQVRKCVSSSGLSSGNSAGFASGPFLWSYAEYTIRAEEEGLTTHLRHLSHWSGMDDQLADGARLSARDSPIWSRPDASGSGQAVGRLLIADSGADRAPELGVSDGTSAAYKLFRESYPSISS